MRPAPEPANPSVRNPVHHYVLRCELSTSASIGETFGVFENPRNLAALTPPWLNFRITTPGEIEMRKGAAIDYRIQWLGLPLRWRTSITDYEPPYHFVDVQARGPYVLWHHLHTFREEEHGTVVGDEVRYVLPLGPLGRLAHGAMVGRQLRGIFEYRQKALGRLLGGVTVLHSPWIRREETWPPRAQEGQTRPGPAVPRMTGRDSAKT